MTTSASDRPIEDQAADLLDQRGGMERLDRALRRKGFTLAAYLTEHEKHRLEHAVYSNCEECMRGAIEG